MFTIDINSFVSRMRKETIRNRDLTQCSLVSWSSGLCANIINRKLRREHARDPRKMTKNRAIILQRWSFADRQLFPEAVYGSPEIRGGVRATDQGRDGSQ
jgi:hypothetical protein